MVTEICQKFEADHELDRKNDTESHTFPVLSCFLPVTWTKKRPKICYHMKLYLDSVFSSQEIDMQKCLALL